MQGAITLTKGQLAAVVAGNALEFYDFLTFSFFAVPIGEAFFPGHDETHRLLLTLATFGAGFLTRPVGGAMIGILGDRKGRRPAMLLSFALMGVSILGLALTPSYGRIGIAAPLLALFFRLVQGFALGGEVGPTTALLLEAAPLARRGSYVSLQNATQYFSTLCAGLVGFGLAAVMPVPAFTQWGWRIAMLLGVSVVPFALALRRRSPETLQTQSAAPHRFSRTQLRLGLIALGLFASNTISTYMMNYMTTYALHTLRLAAPVAFAASAVTGSCAMLGALCGGWASDRWGRKPVMTTGLLLLASGVPAFMAIAASHSAAVLLAACVPTAFFTGIFAPAILTALSESLAPGLRAGSLGILYAVAIAGFGGTAQYVVTWLIAATGSPLAPAWYMSAALVVGLGASLFLRESAPAKIRPRQINDA